ncbi:hypothetical protein R1flu_022416 [Riccia fluitans]|uniref:Uncharacterized protein n=1 Tax=Riccia fluitans TaxID=41844 RepID=A0ABD1ZSA6_9MARC
MSSSTPITMACLLHRQRRPYLSLRCAEDPGVRWSGDTWLGLGVRLRQQSARAFNKGLLATGLISSSQNEATSLVRERQAVNAVQGGGGRGGGGGGINTANWAM